ncbi:BNR-4 repeat-containing protein [Noviluteimonas gilva]|uniref:LamG domain-containing protein n=1 Tax=Noviluteimonas gilva TaxID=2682097 RepID=A0A7C9LGY3_9GAMM|nr:BNR-4 repeat-containing protein [Lysobacter gilvus]MUV13600.1 hypothetical protein [Lysobacter gilvus]
MLLGMFAPRDLGPDPPIPFYSSDLMLTPGWEPVSGPGGFYESGANKTYVAWQFVGTNGFKGVHAAAYDHASETWGERYKVGTFSLASDDHGHPALVRDASGYIHCFFGSHSTSQKWSVTNAADNISAWTQQADIGSAYTYPKAVLVGSKIYLFVRDSASGTNQFLAYSSVTPSSGVGSFAAFTSLVNYGANSRVYSANCNAVGTDIHFVCTYTTAADTARQNVYYYVLDTTTGNVRNYDSSTTVTAGSLPVTKAQSDSSFRIYNHGTNDGDAPSMQFDTSGNPHVLFADGVTPNYDLKHIMLSGGSWTSPVTVASVVDISPTSGYVGSHCLVPGPSGTMEVWYNVSGDKMRRVRNAGGVWSTAVMVEAATAQGDFVGGGAIFGAHSNFRTLFSRTANWTTDADAALIDLYGYGDSGTMTDAIPMTAVDPAGWGNVVLMLGCNHRNNAVTTINDSNSCFRSTFVGNAKIDTSQALVGSASLRLDGTGDYITFADHADLRTSGTGDVSIDMYVRLNELGRIQAFAGKRTAAGNGGFTFYMNASNQLGFLLFNASTAVVNIVGSTAMTTGTWYHIEWSRISNVSYLFLNGALQGSATQASTPTDSGQAFTIGRDPFNTARDFNGWMQEIRFTRAGRHSSAFTAPTTAFPRR